MALFRVPFVGGPHDGAVAKEERAPREGDAKWLNLRASRFHAAVYAYIYARQRWVFVEYEHKGRRYG